MTMNDKFSIERLKQVWFYYSPGMARHLMITGGLTLVAYIICLLATHVFWGILLYSVMSYVTTITFCCGPLHFARFRDTAFNLQLPAAAGERTAVMLGYTLVIVPGVMAAVWFGASFIAGLFTENASVANMVLMKFMNSLDADKNAIEELDGILKYSWIQQLQNIIPALVCLLCVVLSRRNKVLMGVIGILCAYVAMTVIASLVTAILAVLSIDMSDIGSSIGNKTLFIENFEHMMEFFMYFMALIALATTAFSVFRLNRAFRHQQA